jgi:hypothetical protein
MMMLQRLTLKTQRKIRLVDSATKSTTAGIHRHLETVNTAVWYHERCAVSEGSKKLIFGKYIWGSVNSIYCATDTFLLADYTYCHVLV